LPRTFGRIQTLPGVVKGEYPERRGGSEEGKEGAKKKRQTPCN